MTRILDRWAERAIVTALRQWTTGRLTVAGAVRHVRRSARARSRRRRCAIHSPRFFRRVLTDGEIGLGESYMDGDWSTPDLVGLVRLMFANSHVVSAPPAFADLAGAASRSARASPARQLAHRQPPQHPRALRSRQRVLPPVPRRQPAVLVRALRSRRRFARGRAGQQAARDLPEAAISARAITSSRSAAAGAASRCSPPRATAAA